MTHFSLITDVHFEVKHQKTYIPLWGPCILLIQDWAFGPSHVASGSLWNSCLKSVNLPWEKAWAKDAGQLTVQCKCPTENQGSQCHFQGGLVAHCCCTPHVLMSPGAMRYSTLWWPTNLKSNMTSTATLNWDQTVHEREFLEILGVQGFFGYVESWAEGNSDQLLGLEITARPFYGFEI